MTKINFIFYFSLFLLQFACQNEKQAPESSTGRDTISSTAPAPQGRLPLKIEMVSFRKDSGNCDQDSTGCAWVDLIYPLAKNSRKPVRDSINGYISQYLNMSIGHSEPGKKVTESLEQTSENFLNDFLEFQKEDPESPGGWVVETESYILLQTQQLLSLSLATYSYTGGAHGNYYNTLVTFDLNTGKQITFDNVIADTSAFINLAQEAFVAARKEIDEENFHQEDFFWGNPFHLPANFGFTKEGLLFYYNPYEIAAYVYGPTEFVVSYDKLKDAIHKNYVPG